MIMKLDRQSNVPFYRQLADSLTELIKHGDLKGGTRLSVRKIAKEYKVGRGTAETTLEILKDEGYLETRPRSGTFVCSNAWNLLLTGKTPDWHSYSSRGFHLANEEIISVMNNRASDPSKLHIESCHFYEPDFDPYAPLVHALSELNSKKYLSMLNLHDKRGLPFLREAVAKHVLKHGIKVSAENIVIFNGLYEALTSIIHAFLFHGANVFLAENDVIAAMANIREVGANIHGLATDRDGIVPSDFRLKASAKKYSLLYINPVSHFPTGVNISAGRRGELLEEIGKLRFPVIENDMLRDIGKDVPPPFKADDRNEQIIYIGSFANTYLGASKTAWMVAPAAVIDRICDVKIQYSALTNTVLELLAYIMLSSGRYDECMERIRAKLDTRTVRINEILHKYMSGIAGWDEECIRYHVWLKFIEAINTDRLFMDCPGIVFVPGRVHHNKQCILLNSVSTSIEDFETAIRRIASAARRRYRHI
jgi:GntR family transcriptional regulator of abcA and norABC